MSIKTLVLAASMLLAFSSASVWAASHEKAEVKTEAPVACITEFNLDELSDEDKAKNQLPICEEDAEESDEAPKVEKKAD